MRKLLVLPALGAVAFSLVLSAPQQATARPDYHKVFVEVYGEYKGDDAAAKKAAEEIKKLATDKKCTVCHSDATGASKKLQSEFAGALKEELAKAVKAKDAAATPAYPIKDLEIIKTALTKVADVKVKGSEDTYGKLLKAGKLPAPYKAPEDAKPATP